MLEPHHTKWLPVHMIRFVHPLKFSIKALLNMPTVIESTHSMSCTALPAAASSRQCSAIATSRCHHGHTAAHAHTARSTQLTVMVAFIPAPEWGSQ